MTAAPPRRSSLADRFVELRRTEFSRLEAAGETYLDYTGSGLYPESLVRDHAALLAGTVLGNPHSVSSTSLRSTTILEEARAAVIRHFQADPTEYDVAFTANATQAIKLVGESFPFRPGSRILLPADNHNSANGAREFARRRGANIGYWSLDQELRLAAHEIPPAGAPSVLVFPAQSNFSGVQHPLELVAEAARLGWRVLLDAAAFAPTNPLDLSVHRPDFVALSFYKMFGYPSGVGALVARREALAELERPWFAGGTVLYASVQNDVHRLLPGADAFHDGTPNFLALPAVTAGLAFLDDVGMTHIHRHVGGLLKRLLQQLGALAHGDGRRLVKIYGPETLERRGATVAFNLMNRHGAPVPYDVVEARAASRQISLRGGCFCNPGASEAAFGLEPAVMQRCFDELGAEFTPQGLAACLGKPAGAVRVSLGMATDAADIERLVSFLDTFVDR